MIAVIASETYGTTHAVVFVEVTGEAQARALVRAACLASEGHVLLCVIDGLAWWNPGLDRMTAGEFTEHLSHLGFWAEPGATLEEILAAADDFDDSPLTPEVDSA